MYITKLSIKNFRIHLSYYQDDKKSSIGNSESKDDAFRNSFDSEGEPPETPEQEQVYAKSNIVKGESSSVNNKDGENLLDFTICRFFYNNLGPDRLAGPKQIPTIADNQPFDCTTFVQKS